MQDHLVTFICFELNLNLVIVSIVYAYIMQTISHSGIKVKSLFLRGALFASWFENLTS